MLLCSRIKQKNLLHKPLPMSIILIMINSHPRFSSRTLVTMMFFDSLALKIDFLPNVSFNLWSLVFAFSYIGVQVKSYSLGRLQAVSCVLCLVLQLWFGYFLFDVCFYCYALGRRKKTDILRSGWPKAFTPSPFGQLFVKFFCVFFYLRLWFYVLGFQTKKSQFLKYHKPLS